MSRYYEMSVTVAVKDISEADAVYEALCKEWNFDDLEGPYSYKPEDRPKIWMCGRSNLCGGESEDEFVARCYRAVLKVLQRPTEINVVCSYLEDIPYESYTCSEDDAAKILTELGEEVHS